MQSVCDIPLFDAADYLETPRDCADFLLDLIHDGSGDDLRRGLTAVARAGGRPVDNPAREVFDAMISGDPVRDEFTRLRLEGAGVRMPDDVARSS